MTAVSDVEPDPDVPRPAPAAAAAADPWPLLRRLTPARIGLGRRGVSQPTEVQLDFQLAHARARDAVHCALDVDDVCSAIEALGLPTITLHSAAESRAVYLQRPDLGRRLDDSSRQRLRGDRGTGALAAEQPDLALVVADGLSALAVQRHAAALIGALLPALQPADAADGWRLAPVAVVEQGRVAVGDEVGHLLAARIVVVLIGERPGLSSPDSLGIYLTWDPRPGRHDAQRNCISNVRPEGLGYAQAAGRLAYLLKASRQRAESGVGLKDESEPALDRPATAVPGLPAFLGGET